MRSSSILMAAAVVASLSACSSVMGGTNFSGIPPMPEQAQDSASPRLAQYPADPPVAMHLDRVQTSPYDSPDFVVPPYEIEP